MRYLTLAEVLDLHRRVIEQTGGADGIRDLGGVESAVAQPQMSFDGVPLYPTIADGMDVPHDVIQGVSCKDLARFFDRRFRIAIKVLRNPILNDIDLKIARTILPLELQAAVASWINMRSRDSFRTTERRQQPPSGVQRATLRTRRPVAIPAIRQLGIMAWN